MNVIRNAAVMIVAVLVVFFSLKSQSSSTALESNSATDGDQYESALSKERELALKSAPIKSQQDLDSYQRTFSAERSPLAKMSVDAQERFINSLSFNEKGITGFSYADLEAQLTPTETHAVLSLFGVQHLTGKLRNNRVETATDRFLQPAQNSGVTAKGGIFTPELGDYTGYKCVDRATCMEASRYICTSNC